MTERDFELIARALRATGKCPLPDDAGAIAGFQAGKDAVAERLADCLSLENPRFDRARFLKACGVDA